ncbi:hypothetical protein DL95DRAFT_465335 [Leptodontidium sp. 2 PMI_412]|nr:hypothetical protein DL95DRAFT_465335 [Leptodontidium sp. 2 PMI_412]
MASLTDENWLKCFLDEKIEYEKNNRKLADVDQAASSRRPTPSFHSSNNDDLHSRIPDAQAVTQTSAQAAESSMSLSSQESQKMTGLRQLQHEQDPGPHRQRYGIEPQTASEAIMTNELQPQVLQQYQCQQVTHTSRAQIKYSRHKWTPSGSSK